MDYPGNGTIQGTPKWISELNFGVVLALVIDLANATNCNPVNDF